MVVEIGERRRKRRGVWLRTRRRLDVARHAGEPYDPPVPVPQRLLPGHAPSLLPVGIEVQFQPAVDRNSLTQHAGILVVETFAERRWKDLTRRSSDKIGFAAKIAT